MSHTVNGQLVLSPDEQDALRYAPEERPMTQKEIDEQKMREQQAEAKRQAAISLEKGKQSAWTHAKLETLAVRWAHKRKSPNKSPDEFKRPPGSIKQELDVVWPILDNHFGEPLEFTKDLNLISNGFKNETLVIDGNEMQSLAENTEGKKFLYGLLIQRHIFDQKFSISIGDNNQPTLRDESWDQSQKRQEQMTWLQRALSEYEFSESKKSPFKKNDNTSLAAEYIAASIYRNHPDLVGFRNDLYRKIWLQNNTLLSEENKKRIEESNLLPDEKSFLLAWRDTRKDSVLNQIQSKQEQYVKNARENFNQKSPETHLNELMEKPFTKSAQLLAAGAIGAALLVFAYKQMKKWGFWGTLSWLIAGLIGGSIILPLGDKAWKTFGLWEKLKDINEWKPINRDDANDNSFANLDKSIIAPIQTNWARFQARLAGGQEGINILMNKDVGQDIATKYPVYAMLNILNPEDTNTWGKYEDPKVLPGTTLAAIKTWLNKLPTGPENQQAQLNTLAKDTWERYQKTQQFTTNGWKDKAKTTNLADMLAAIEKEDGWLNAIISKVSNEPKRKEALKVIGQNPKEWSKISIGDIKKYFLNQPEPPADDWRKTHKIVQLINECKKRTINPIANPTGILIDYFKTQDLSKPEDGAKTLKDFLEKE